MTFAKGLFMVNYLIDIRTIDISFRFFGQSWPYLSSSSLFGCLLLVLTIQSVIKFLLIIVHFAVVFEVIMTTFTIHPLKFISWLTKSLVIIVGLVIFPSIAALAATCPVGCVSSTLIYR